MPIDLNCDLGEGEPVSRTRALMRSITSANIACGGHAGDIQTMQTCVRLAKQWRVRLGAHPGPWSRHDFGRGTVTLTPDDLELLLLQQVGALERIARSVGVRLQHVKLHGALYHASETEAALGRRYVAAVGHWWPGVKIFARAGGNVVRTAQRMGVPVWEEGFVDRAYLADGNLVPRDQPGALLTELSQIACRIESIQERGEVSTIAGGRMRLRPQTLCVHSDTPHSCQIAHAVGRLLGKRSGRG